jgi:hypothetical protein
MLDWVVIVGDGRFGENASAFSFSRSYFICRNKACYYYFIVLPHFILHRPMLLIWRLASCLIPSFEVKRRRRRLDRRFVGLESDIQSPLTTDYAASETGDLYISECPTPDFQRQGGKAKHKAAISQECPAIEGV